MQRGGGGAASERRESEGSRDRDKEKEEGEKIVGGRECKRRRGARHENHQNEYKNKTALPKPLDATGSEHKGACNEA